MAEEHTQELHKLPQPKSTRLIDFEHVQILSTKSIPPQHILVVSGTKPYFHMKVTLSPLTYIQQPEYWGIEVVGSVGGIGLPATAPYSVSLPLAGFIGKRGIEVIGASRSERHDISTKGPGQDQLPPALFKHWVHSFEESDDQADVYRPTGFAFPPAFGRTGLEIKAGGVFILHAIGPADGTIAIPGHWSAKGPDKLKVLLRDHPPFTLKILSVDDDVLRIEPGSNL
jgi:hypothetical protein